MQANQFNRWIPFVLLVTIVAVLLSFLVNVYILPEYLRKYSAIYLQSFGYLGDLIVPATNEDPFSNNIGRFKVNNSSCSSIRPTSLWCSPDLDHCRFESICYKPESSEYVFAFDTKLSTFYPPRLRYLPNQTSFGRLSAVWDHNLYGFKDYVTIPFSELAKLNRTVYYLPGNTLVMSRFKPDNWMHLIHDDIVPLFATIKQYDLDNRVDQIFFDDNWPDTFGGFLFTSLFPAQLLFKGQFEANSLVCFENVHIGLSMSTVWYQYGFVKPQSPVERTPEEIVYIRNILESLRNELVSRLKIDQTCSSKHSLLIVRKLNRRILNYQEFYHFLQKRFLNLKLLILESSFVNENFSQLLETLVCTDTLISMHGSEQILSMFIHSSPSSKIIELFPYGIEPDSYRPYRTLATLLDYRYYAWSNANLTNARFHANDYPPEWGGLSHLPDSERLRIETGIENRLLPHLCCDNHDWLYRIYQDTLIDTEQFGMFLDEQFNTSKQLNFNQYSPSDIFRLSEVQNLTCLTLPESPVKLVISWHQPWNLKLLSSYNIDLTMGYEVLIQRLGSNQGFVMETKQTTLTILYSTIDCSDSVGCNIWVKPKPVISDNHKIRFKLIGFFNRLPILCP